MYSIRQKEKSDRKKRKIYEDKIVRKAMTGITSLNFSFKNLMIFTRFR